MIRRIFTPKVVETEGEAPTGFDAYDLRLGDVMRGERATLGKSLLDVQRELKIKATYIAAIENSDPSAFESPSFIAGYVRSYAQYLELDPEWAFEKFCSESDYATAHGMSAQASSVASKAERAARRKNQSRDPLSDPNAAFVPRQDARFAHIEPGAIGSLLVLAALIGGIGYGGWSVLQEVQRVQFAPIEQSPGVASTVNPLVTSGAVMAAVNQSTGFIAPSPDSLDRLYRPQALDVPIMVARDGPIAALNPKVFATPVLEDDQSRPDVQQAIAGQEMPVPAPNQVRIKVVEDTVPEISIFTVRSAWVRIKSADGTVIFEKVMDAGEMFTLPKTVKPLMLRTGFAGTVYFSVNGKTYGPAGEGASVVSEIILAQAEIQQTYALADITGNKELASVVAALSVTPAE